MNRGTINPTPAQSADRSLKRIETLKVAIQKAKDKGNSERVDSLTAELERRTQEIKEFAAQFGNI